MFSKLPFYMIEKLRNQKLRKITPRFDYLVKPNCRRELHSRVFHNGTAFVYPSKKKGTK